MQPRSDQIVAKILSVLALFFFSAGHCLSDERHPDETHATAIQKMVQRIDAALLKEWEEAGIQPAPPAEDTTFLRRAYLDLNGVVPRVSQVREFLADNPADKRSQLIDRLLESPRYASHMATVWRNRIVPQELEMQRMREAVGLQKWLRTRFAKNLRYDNLVSDLLLTTGDDELGPGLYYHAHELAPEKLAASAADLFLGLKLQCAQCHDHPYADWSQRDFWGLAAFFARVRSPENRTMQVSYRLVDSSSGEVQLPDSDETVAPKYLHAEIATDQQFQSRRMQLALWMTSRDNRFFVRAAVNWAWYHLFGLGLVESLDKIDTDNLSVEQQLLEELADYFVETNFDLQALFRTLANTRAYQLSGRNDNRVPDSAHRFSYMLAKPLTPEQLYDSFQILSPINQQTAYQNSANLINSMDVDPVRMDFVRRMRPPAGDPTQFRAGTLQTLMLSNGQTMDNLTAADRSSLLGALSAPYMQEADQVEALFLATLSRPPDADEQNSCLVMLETCESDEEKITALGDILWALVNSTEFGFNR